MALVKAGADRQEMHERLRSQAMTAWQSVRQGEANPLAGLLSADPVLNEFLPPAEIDTLMQVDAYVGIAPQRTRDLAERIRKEVETR
jgi:adenylosuccinate lyase